jgi:autotransporter-associated beta strand protein
MTMNQPLTILLALALTLSWPVRAATDTWLGNTSSSWSVAANWSGSTIPAANDLLLFTNAGTAGASLTNDFVPGRVYDGIVFAPNATNAFVFLGNAFALNGTIVNSNANLQTINNSIILTNAATFNASAGSLVLAGNIGDNGYGVNLTLTGSQGVTLSGSNTFGGALALNNGVSLTIGAITNLGAGTSITFGASSSSYIAVTGSVTIPATTTISIGSGSTAQFGTPTAGTLFQVAALMTGTGAVTRKSSSYSLGTVEFSNDGNNYTGDFTMGYGNTEYTSVANLGQPSSLGQGASSSGGQITLGNSASFATFNYVGAGNSASTRPLNWTATTGGLALEANGAGTVAFLTNRVLRAGSGSTTLTLEGTNTGTNTLAQTINDGAASGTTTVTKSGAGTWVLAGTNTFSGGVNLNGGVLQVNANETPGTSGPLGKSGAISFGGGMLQYSPADTYDYSSRFSTAAGQNYSFDTDGQTVTLASALTSSGGSLTVTSLMAGGKLLLAGANTYAGGTTVLGGLVSVGSDANLGASTGNIVLNGGGLSAAASFGLSSSRTVFLGPSSGGGTLDVPAGLNLTFGGTLTDNGAPGLLVKTSGGTLTLSSSALGTYSGGTTISAGTLAISGSANLGASNNLTIASGAMLDVSGIPAGYSLGSAQTLVAGSGASLVNGKLNLGSAALTLFYTNGVPSLTISSNKLVMNNNTTTVTVAGGVPLAVGVYNLVSKAAGGSVSGAVSNSLVNVTGAGAVAGASLQMTSGQLFLNIHGATPTVTTLSSSAGAQTYGNAVTLTADVSPAVASGLVTFSDGTNTYGTVSLTNGQASLFLSGGVLGAGVYPMTASYNGNATYGPSSSGIVTQTISQATLLVAANNLSRWVGNPNPVLTASYLGLVAGDGLSVLAGAPNLTTTATKASPAGPYSIVITPGTLTNVTGNYALVFSNGTLSVTARAMPYPQGTAFPLMMYEVDDAPSATNVAAYGWNIIQQYGLSTNSLINTFLALAYSNSLGGDVPIPCGGSVTTNFEEWPQAQVAAWIRGSLTNNNIAWWDMPEEMRSWEPAEVQLLKDYHAWVRLYDTNGPRPTYEYTPNDRITSTQIGVVTNVDIIAASCYCEAQGQPHAWVRYKVQQSGIQAVIQGGCSIGSNYLAGQKTVVADLYCATNSSGINATPEQCYHDVWSAIASGAQGIEVYAYWHAINDTPPLINNLQQYNLAASQIGGSAIGPMILYGTANTNVSFVVTSGPTNTVSFNPGDGTNWQYPSINVLCKTWSNNVYLVAVNSTSNCVTAIITNLPATTGPASLPFEVRSVPVSGNGFVDTFQPWGVHVYQIAAAVVAPPPPVISSIAAAAGQVVLSCSGSPGRNYVLLLSTNLANSAGWSNLSTNLAPGSGLFSCTNIASNAAAFYRLQQQ